MQASLEQISMPEGVEFVEIATESGKGFRLVDGYLYGSPTHPYGPGAVVVKIADGYEQAYNIQIDGYDVVKKLPAPKLMTVTLRITNERDLAKLQRAAPMWPGFVGVEEVASEPIPLDASMSA